MPKTFSTPRDLEFASPGELAKRMGAPRALWLRAALKELIDNALDACEEAGFVPDIMVEIAAAGRVTVRDNGPGIPPEVVELLCQRDLRTSSREAYAEPSRGAQGNALQVLMCLPLGLGQDVARTTIVARGVEHEIVVKVNRLAGRLDVEHTQRAAAETPGTAVTIELPGLVELPEVGGIVDNFASLNPHAGFTLGGVATIEPRDPGFRKWKPGRPTSPHWYSRDRFAHRILAELRRDPRLTVAQFLGGFAGLTDRSRRARIAEAAGLQYRPLSAALDAAGTAVDLDVARELLDAMQAEAVAPKPVVMGRLGKDAALWAAAGGRSEHDEDVRGLAYHIVTSDECEVPWVWEVAFAQLPGLTRRRLVVGTNFSPAIAPDLMLRGFLAPSWRGLPDFLGEGEKIGLLVHRISPARATLDYGKQRADVGYTEAAALVEAVERVTAPWVKARRRQERTGRAASLPPPSRTERVTIRDAVFQYLPAAYAQASSDGRFPARARQIYYALRPLVLATTERETFDAGYFSARLLPEYMQENPKQCSRWRVHFDPRGTLHEPHTGATVGLGTAAVESYIGGWTNGEIEPYRPPPVGWSAPTAGPRNRFGAVVIVEKEGIADLLLMTGVGERHDVAMVGGKGQATEAALRLADELALPVFVLHDFDRTGLTIAANLRDGTWRHRYRNQFWVIDVGLRLHQVEGLESEPIDAANRKSVTAHSDEAGRGFRFEGGRHSNLKPARRGGVSAGRGG
jgi:hypothetical protein